MANTNKRYQLINPYSSRQFSVLGATEQLGNIANNPYPWMDTSNQSFMPRTSTRNIPQAASTTNTSANVSDKSYGLNTGQITALASGALGMFGNYIGATYQARSLNAQAESYLGQIPLNYAAYRDNVEYVTEENLQNVANILSEGNRMEGIQLTAMGASGFDVSAGDQRIIEDTKTKMNSDVYLANRSAYLQSYELWRSTEAENARLLAAAQIAKNQAKLIKRSRYFNLMSGAINTAAGVMNAAYGPKLQTKEVKTT